MTPNPSLKDLVWKIDQFFMPDDKVIEVIEVSDLIAYFKEKDRFCKDNHGIDSCNCSEVLEKMITELEAK